MLQRYQNILEEAINNYTLPAEPHNLYDPIRYILSIGGKRIRPVLVLLAADLFCDDPAAAINAALAIEVFHNFTLIHDDIMDNAPLRRGRQTVHTKWDKNVAILSGDVMMVEANKQLTRTDAPYLKAVLDVFNQTAQNVCEGQQLDMDFENRDDVGLPEYLHMITLKTAVLLGGALKLGAIIGGASKEDAEMIYRAGVNLGIGFQIQDDVLDVYGDPTKFGKQTGGDILANKKTWLLLTAMESEDNDVKQELTQLFTTNSEGAEGTAKIARVREIFNTVQVPAKAEAVIEQYHLAALEDIEKLDIAPDKIELLKMLALSILKRDI